MDQVQIANILLTRRCNLTCSYCNIVRDYPDMPEDYLPMKYYAQHELTGEEWIEIFSRLVKNNPNVFFVIYGGEPFVYKDLWKIIKYCNNNDVSYTVISNNTDIIQNQIHEVYEKCGQFKGFSSSVDPIISGNIKGDGVDIRKKSNLGMTRLIKMKKDGIVDDAVAEITVMKSTIPHLYNTIKTLSKNGIYSSITTLDDAKNKYYDFARVLDESEMIPANDIDLLDQFTLIKEDKSLLIHMPELLDVIFDSLPSNRRCRLDRDITNVTVDADGSFRLCLRIRGVQSPSLKLNDVISSDGYIQEKFNSYIKNDMDNYCQNCIWTCLMMSEMFTDQIINHGKQNK